MPVVCGGLVGLCGGVGGLGSYPVLSRPSGSRLGPFLGLLGPARGRASLTLPPVSSGLVLP